MYTYDEVQRNFPPGSELEYYCQYTDTEEFEPAGKGIYIVGEPAPAAPGSAQPQAQAALESMIKLWLPLPEVTAKPSLTNQRVGFETWIGLPTFGPPPPRQDDQGLLTLSVAPNIKATFSVPVRRGRTETFNCEHSGLDAGGEPDGTCAHRFDYATDGTVEATVTITYQVLFTSPLTGETDAPLGPVPRTATIPMNVRDLQAVAS